MPYARFRFTPAQNEVLDDLAKAVAAAVPSDVGVFYPQAVPEAEPGCHRYHVTAAGGLHTHDVDTVDTALHAVVERHGWHQMEVVCVSWALSKRKQPQVLLHVASVDDELGARCRAVADALQPCHDFYAQPGNAHITLGTLHPTDGGSCAKLMRLLHRTSPVGFGGVVPPLVVTALEYEPDGVAAPPLPVALPPRPTPPPPALVAAQRSRWDDVLAAVAGVGSRDPAAGSGAAPGSGDGGGAGAGLGAGAGSGAGPGAGGGVGVGAGAGAGAGPGAGAEPLPPGDPSACLAVRARDAWGFTCLHHAAWHGASATVVQQLLCAGASVHAASVDGATPMDVAKQRLFEPLPGDATGTQRATAACRLAEGELQPAATVVRVHTPRFSCLQPVDGTMFPQQLFSCLEELVPRLSKPALSAVLDAHNPYGDGYNTADAFRDAPPDVRWVLKRHPAKPSTKLHCSLAPPPADATYAADPAKRSKPYGNVSPSFRMAMWVTLRVDICVPPTLPPLAPRSYDNPHFTFALLGYEVAAP